MKQVRKASPRRPFPLDEFSIFAQAGVGSGRKADGTLFSFKFNDPPGVNEKVGGVCGVRLAFAFAFRMEAWGVLGVLGVFRPMARGGEILGDRRVT